MTDGTLTGYGKTWPLYCERVNGIDVFSLSPEDKAEHNRLQDEAAMRDLGQLRQPFNH